LGVGPPVGFVPRVNEATPARVQEEAHSVFTTTSWTLVLQAGRAESAEAAAALERLCTAYWYPLYAYVRRQGHSPHDAQDLVQEFFARLLERNYLRLADRNRGRFRTFLLTALQYFLINEWKHANRQKRGGGRAFSSIDRESTETRFVTEIPDHRSPDKAFDRRWALVLLGRVLDQLQAECVADNRGALFEELKSALTGGETADGYAEIASRLGITEGNLKVIAHRLRGRYRELLRREVAITVEGPQAVDEEIRDLLAALGEG
jgi:RNA polymerase sigma factor (sigma-70 family)